MYFKCCLSDLFKDMLEDLGANCMINDIGSMIDKPVHIDGILAGMIKAINVETDEVLIFMFKSPLWKFTLDNDKNIESLDSLSLVFPTDKFEDELREEL